MCVPARTSFVAGFFMAVTIYLFQCLFKNDEIRIFYLARRSVYVHFLFFAAVTYFFFGISPFLSFFVLPHSMYSFPSCTIRLGPVSYASAARAKPNASVSE